MVWYTAGLPKSGDMQLLFWQFALNKLQKNGRAAIICNATPLFLGGSTSGESQIRKWLFEKDYIEAIIEFCPELFYNTGISIYALIFNKQKSEQRKGKIQLIDARALCRRLNKGLGYKRNELSPQHIEEIVRLYKTFESNDCVKILTKEDFYYKDVPCYQPFQRNFSITKERIENLYGIQAFKKLFDEDKFNELEELPSKTKAQLDKINSYLEGKKIQVHIINTLNANLSSEIYKNKKEFTKIIEGLFPELVSNKSLIKGIVLALSEDDDTADKYYDKKGKVEIDSDLTGSELIPYKIDNDEYFKTEVLPFVNDAFLETNKDKITIGCEINFNKYFYKFIEPEPSSEILKRLKSLDLIENDLESDLYE